MNYRILSMESNAKMFIQKVNALELHTVKESYCRETFSEQISLPTLEAHTLFGLVRLWTGRSSTIHVEPYNSWKLHSYL